MRGMLGRAGRPGGSALVLLAARCSGSAGCWPPARIQRPDILRAQYRGLLAFSAVPRACWARCPGIGRAPAPGPGLTRGRGAAAAGRRRPRAVRPSVCPPPPARRGAAAPPAGPLGAPGVRALGAAAPPSRRDRPAPRASGGRRGKPAPLPGEPLPAGKGRPRQGLMPPHLSRPGRGGRGRGREEEPCRHCGGSRYLTGDITGSLRSAQEAPGAVTGPACRPRGALVGPAGVSPAGSAWLPPPALPLLPGRPASPSPPRGHRAAPSQRRAAAGERSLRPPRQVSRAGRGSAGAAIPGPGMRGRLA